MNEMGRNESTEILLDCSEKTLETSRSQESDDIGDFEGARVSKRARERGYLIANEISPKRIPG